MKSSVKVTISQSRFHLPKESSDKYGWVKQASVFTTIPMILLVGPLLGGFIGNLLDKRLGTHPYLAVALGVLGFVASGQEVYRLIKKFGSKD